MTDSGNRWTLDRSRIAAFVLLGVVTAYGVYQFAGGEWRVALESWRGRISVLPVVLALAALDVGLEAFAAMWVYERFGVRAFDIRGDGDYAFSLQRALIAGHPAAVIAP